ncbi:glucokinase, partial [Bacillus sp. AFS051223]
MKVYLGIDIGGTFIKYGIVNSTGNILFKDKVPTDRVKPEAVLNS